MANENKIVRENWQSSFSLVGEAKVSDYTFKIDAQSERSDWIYNALNLNVDCGEKYGVVSASMMGGYGANRDNVIYAHGKNEDGKDDYKLAMEVAWDDRFDPDVLDNVGSGCFYTVGLEKTTDGKTYYKNFLSPYDAIAYMHEHLETGMVVRVRGQLKYSMYNDNVQVKKEIKSIVLSSVDSKDKYSATFLQSVLLDKDSASLKNIDKEKSVMFVDARVLDYVKEINGVEVRGQYPFNKTFEWEMDFSKPDICKKIVDKIFKVKKDITQIAFEGDFIEGGAAVTATWDDVPDAMKEMVELGVFTKDDVLERCSVNGNRERRMVLRKPYFRLEGEEGNKTQVLQRIDNAYTEDDLVVGVALEAEDDASDDDSFDADDWLANL